MNDKRDPLEQALEALKTRSRGRAMSDVNLEDQLMQEFDKVRVQRRRRWTTALVAGLVFAASSVGFAAAGGVEAVKSWFVVELEFVNTNGEKSTETFELQGNQLRDANGNPIGEVTLSFSNEEGEEEGAE